MLRKFVLSVMAICVMASSALAEKVYVVASDCCWPPLEFVDSNKQLVGYELDYVQAVAKEAGIKVEIRNTAWDGIFASLGNRQADIICSGVTVTEERKKTLAFAEPFMIAKQAIVVLNTNTTVKEMKDLNGLKVGGQIGTTGLIQTMKKAKKNVAKKAIVKSYDEVGLAFADLAKGAIDAVICDSPIASQYAKNQPEYAGMMHVAFSTDDVQEEIAFAVRKDDTDLLAKLNAGIKAVKSNGTAKSLQEKWGIVD